MDSRWRIPIILALVSSVGSFAAPVESALRFRTVPGSKVLLKVVANADGIMAAARAPGDRAFRLDLLKPYFVVGEDGSAWRITPTQSATASTGWVNKSDVYIWNTREGLHLNRTNLQLPTGERPRLAAWHNRRTLEQFLTTGNRTLYGPAFLESAGAALPARLEPYPLLQLVPFKSKELERKMYRVLIAAHTAGVETTLRPEEVRQVLQAVTFCVVFDITASMKPHAETMARTISGLMQGLGQSGQNAAAGLVLFRDLGDSERYKIELPATLDKAAELLMKAAPTAAGGGDPPEPILDAVSIGADLFNWNGGIARRGAKKVIIAVLNEDAKIKTVGLAPIVRIGQDADDIVRSLNRKNITVFSLQAGSRDGGNLAKVMTALANGTGGEYYPYGADTNQYSRAFASNVRRLISNTVDATRSEAVRIGGKTAATSGGSFISLELSRENLARLSAAGTVRVRNGTFIQEAWMVEQRDLYQEKILVDKATLHQLLLFLNVISATTPDAPTLVRTIRENLQAFLGEQIPVDAEVQELLEKKVGISFQTEMLAFSLDGFGAMNVAERLRLQKRIETSALRLAKFMELNAATLDRDGQIWVPTEVLP